MRCVLTAVLFSLCVGCGSAVIPALPSGSGTGSTPAAQPVFTGFAGGHNDLVTGVTYDSVSSLIYVVGMSFDLSGNRYGYIARYTAAGALDTTFNAPNGYRLSPAGGFASGFADYFNSIVIDAIGRPIICGSSRDASGNLRSLVVGYTTAGNLLFNTVGAAAGFAGGGRDFFNGAAISPAGNIFCGGYSRSSTAGVQRSVIARYQAGGVIDTVNFGTPNGYVLGPAAGFGGGGVDVFNSIYLDPTTWSIVGVGTSTNGAGDVMSLTVRYLFAGALDTGGFNAPNGYALGTSNGLALGHSDSANAVVIDAGSSVFTTGSTLNPSLNSRTFLMKYLSTGVLDTAGFGNPNGYALGPNPGFASSTTDNFYAIGLDPITGRILAAGRSYNGTVYQYLVTRYTTAGALDTTFNTTGYALGTLTNNTVAGDSSVTGLAMDAAQNVIMGGTISFSNGYQQPFLIEYDVTGARVF
jgi:uncharacterized delta-60 repeat protein